MEIYSASSSPEGKTVDGGCLLLLSCLTPSGFTCYPWGRIHWTKAKSGERCYDLQQLHLCLESRHRWWGISIQRFYKEHRPLECGQNHQDIKIEFVWHVLCTYYVCFIRIQFTVNKINQQCGTRSTGLCQETPFWGLQGSSCLQQLAEMQQEFHVPRAFRQNETKTLRGVVIHFRLWCCQLSGIVKSGSRQLWMAKFPLLGIFRAFREENLLESQTLCSLLTPSLLAEQWSIQSGFVGAWKKAIVKHTYLYYQILYNIICTFIMKWTWCSSMYIDITHRISIKAHGVL